MPPARRRRAERGRSCARISPSPAWMAIESDGAATLQLGLRHRSDAARRVGGRLCRCAGEGRPDGRSRARDIGRKGQKTADRSEEHTSELQSLMRISYAVFCLKKKKKHKRNEHKKRNL